MIKAIKIDVNKNADIQNIDDILKALVYPPVSKGNPKLFMLKGSLDKSCRLEAGQFRAHI